MTVLQINSIQYLWKCFCFTLVCLAQTGGRSINDLCSLLDVWHQEGQSLWFLIRSIRFYSCFRFVFFRPVWGKEIGYNMREYFSTRHTVSSAFVNRGKYQRQRIKTKPSLLKRNLCLSVPSGSPLNAAISSSNTEHAMLPWFDRQMYGWYEQWKYEHKASDSSRAVSASTFQASWLLPCRLTWCLHTFTQY